MSAAAVLPRIDARPLIFFSVLLVGLAVALSPPAYADEGSVFGDVVVERGTHEDEVWTVFGDAAVRGQVSGDVHSAFGDVRIEGPVGGDVNCGFGDLTVLDTVGGEVDAGFGDVYVDSPVGGGLDVNHGSVTLGPGAEIMRRTYVGSGELEEAPGAVVHRPMKAGMMPGFERDGGGDLLGLAGWFFGAVGFAACAVLASVLAPRSLSAAARRAEEATGRSLLVGLLSLPAVLVLSVALAVSVVGVPMLLLIAPAYLAFVFYGALVAAFAVGRKVVLATGRYRSGNALAAGVGAGLVSVLVLVPFFGELLLFGLALLGAGAALLALVSRHRPGRPPAYPSYESYVQERRDA